MFLSRLVLKAQTALTFLIFSTMTQASSINFFIGTQTKPGGSEGIYSATLDTNTGTMTSPVLVAKANSPSFVAVSKDNRFLYACEEGEEGMVTAFEISKERTLKEINTQPSGGRGPCHVSLDTNQTHVLVANYSEGSISVFPRAEDGSLLPASDFKKFAGSGPDLKRQTAPHAHGIYADPTNQFVFVCDLGTDQVRIFRSKKGELKEVAEGRVPPGGGPRHLAIHPTIPIIYVNNEMTLSTTVFAWNDAEATLTPLQTLTTVPEGTDIEGNSTAEIICHPSGKWLYVSNRGHDSIAVYGIKEDGLLSSAIFYPAGVKTPRGFDIDPAGQWLVVGGQDDDRVVVLKIDQSHGGLSGTGVNTTVPRPVCIAFEHGK